MREDSMACWGAALKMDRSGQEVKLTEVVMDREVEPERRTSRLALGSGLQCPAQPFTLPITEKGALRGQFPWGNIAHLGTW